ncbi:MAG: hypothetical protein BAJATHORv1_40347 [Candidatus Thorarchaeota archaeon]|nr:MAG: hypothetical protein BAJATHORv1_40347 [Candidatus Thorarchaeota archaeon]
MKEGTQELDQSKDSERIEVRFRDLIPEIPRTTYGTFGIYGYPAKFIPQIVAYPIKKFAEKNDVIFDPFGGYGTTGLVSKVYGYDYVLWDLNPLMKLIHDTAIMEQSKIGIDSLIQELKTSKLEFIPKWSRMEYWFPEEFVPMISRAWGYVHSLEYNESLLLKIPLVKTTRFFSWSDEKTHKLYKSKFAKRKIKELRKKDWKSLFYKKLEDEVRKLMDGIKEYSTLNPQDVSYRIKCGIDTLNTDLDEEVDILITSPPYLQAQEYIRSTKLELYWLGHTDKDIRALGRKEIPYNEVKEVEINSETYYKYREQIKEDHLRLLYDRYFHAMIGTFSRVGKKVRNRMCIFVGPAKIRTTEIPIDEILIEHLTQEGWKHEMTYVDTIVSRVMFKSKVNPASGLKDERMKTEHLAVLKHTR